MFGPCFRQHRTSTQTSKRAHAVACPKQQQKENRFLYPVDSRSPKGPNLAPVLFVSHGSPWLLLPQWPSTLFKYSHSPPFVRLESFSDYSFLTTSPSSSPLSKELALASTPFSSTIASSRTTHACPPFAALSHPSIVLSDHLSIVLRYHPSLPSQPSPLFLIHDHRHGQNRRYYQRTETARHNR